MKTDNGIIPSRRVLTEAYKTNQKLGHDNLGSLSESHGFMPLFTPETSFPRSFHAWDEMANELPGHYLTLSLRHAVDNMPLLPAEKADLPDKYLLRASLFLSLLAHAYHYVHPQVPEKLPDCLRLPWETVTRRLRRPAPFLSVIDVWLYNWARIEPDSTAPLQVENMRLLIPVFDNQEERIFHLSTIECSAQCTPIVRAVVCAQEAAVMGDIESLKRELLLIGDCLQQLTHHAFMKTDPNPYSALFVNPLVWTQTLLVQVTRMRDDVPGLGGLMLPIFCLLDAFFGRRGYNTPLGKEMRHYSDWHPQHWRDFFEAVRAISVVDFIDSAKDPILSGVFRDALDKYAGPDGFLAKHRLKAYGYIEQSMKFGRMATNAGQSGALQNRPWDDIDNQWEAARAERYNAFPPFCHHARVKQVNTKNQEGDQWVKQIVLDISNTGIHYKPGDRCSILPDNSPDLIAKTLKALRASGDETIALTRGWQKAVSLRYNHEKSTSLPLRLLLRFGQIRPVQRSVAKLLYRVSFNYTLKQIIEARAEDQWELWSLIELLTLSGFDPQSLWVAQPGENRHICNIVQPLRFRMYSISSATEDSGQRDVQELHLTVGRLSYKTKNTTLSMESEQAGTCSHFLGETAIAHLRKDDRVSFQIVHPPRFGLPQAPDTPIVMFAGGTGLAPFRGFLEARAKQAGGGENWLFFGTRSSNDLYYMEEFASIAASGRLHIRVALSREDATVAFDAGKSRFVVQPGKRARINDVILSEENARLLWDLLRSREDGGKGARFYVCGRTDFANTIMASIKSVLLRYSEGSEQQKHEKVRKKLYRLAAEGNYLQDIFTTYSGSHIEKKQLYNASDVVMHNSEEQGYWIIINGLVYDVSEFSHMHPGGFMIIRGYAGMDGTHAYEKVLHHTNSEVDALLGMYEIGAVRRLDFGSEWSVAIGRSAQQNAFIRHDGLFFITLADIYRLWVRFLYQVVELENTLHNGFTIQHTVLTRNDAADEWSPLKIQYMIETHRHFIEDHISCIADFLQDVWIVTSGMCSTALDVRWMANTLDTLQQTEGARATMQLHEKLLHSQLDAASENPTDNVRTDWLVECCTQLEIDDKQCINAVKLALRDGVKVFEAFERDTPRKGNARLLAVIQSMPQVLEDYYRRVSGQALFAGLD